MYDLGLIRFFGVDHTKVVDLQNIKQTNYENYYRN